MFLEKDAVNTNRRADHMVEVMKPMLVMYLRPPRKVLSGPSCFFPH